MLSRRQNGVEQMQSDGAPWWARLKGKVQGWLKYYWLCLLLLFTALISYIGVLCYQAQIPGDRAQYQVWVTQEIGQGEDRVLLSISYPRELRLESPGELRPISVWLWKATSTASPIPTPAQTFTPTSTSPSSTSILTNALPITPTPTGTPQPWVIAFSPHDAGILFTNQEGVPMAPQVALTPGLKSAAPAVLYIQRAPLVTAPVTVVLNASVYHAGAIPVSTLSAPIELESAHAAACRHFKLLLYGGPAAPLLALAAALIAFSREEWQRRREQEQTEKRQRTLAQVRQLAHFKMQPTQLLLEYWKIREQNRDDADIIERLDNTITEILDPDNLLTATQEWFGELDDERASRVVTLALEQDMKNEIVLAFACVLEYVHQDTTEALPDEQAKKIAHAINQINAVCDDKGKERANQLLADLARKQQWDESQIKAFAVAWGSLRWLELWPASPPADLPAVSEWLKAIGWKFNPFGPEMAELDPRLWQYRVDAVLSQARGKKPTLVFGSPGSGKTATALLLAYDCEDPPASPREAGAFPVCHSLESLGSNFRLYATTIVDATAQALARYLTRRADGFLDLAMPRKYGVARLLSLWAGSREHLEAELQRVGPAQGTFERLVHVITAMYYPVSYERYLDDLANVLSSALPAGFDSLYLLLDLPATSTKPRLKEMVAENLRPLMDLAVPMATRGVYLKLFLPDTLRLYLDNLTIYKVVSLTWDQDNLAHMLEYRLQAAGGNSLTAVCGPGVPADPSPDRRLVQAAAGSPRQLVRLGNELLRTHVEHAPDDLLLSVQAIDDVLGAL